MTPARVWQKCRQLAPYGGTRTFLAGCHQRLRLSWLRRRYGFPSWHLWPVEWREYALEAAVRAQQWIDEEELDTVVEIGCGLGDILGRIRCRERVGYDLDPKVLAAARRRHPAITFRQGSFRDVRERQIDLLIALNFAHEIPPATLAEDLRAVIDHGRPRFLICDEVDYEYFHHYVRLLPAGYGLDWTVEGYPNRRRLRGFRLRSPIPPIARTARAR